METKTIINLLIRIFSLMALGFILKRKGLINNNTQKNLSQLLMSVFLPASILSASSNPFDQGIIIELIVTAIVSISYYLLSFTIFIFIFRKFNIKMNRDKQSIFMNLVIYGNSAFMGYPIIESLFGKQAIIIVVVFNIFWTISFFTIGIFTIQGEKSVDLLASIKTPATLSSFLTLIIYFSPFRLPEVVTVTLSDIGNIVTPISMIIIGAILSEINFRSFLNDGLSFLASLMRLIIVPILGLLILKPFNIPTLAYKTIIVLLAMPSGSTVPIYASLFDKEADFAARGNSLSTALFAFSFPLILLLINIFI